MTNLDWVKTLTAHELADWFYDEWLHHLQYRWSSSRGGLEYWLSEERVADTPQTDCETCRFELYCPEMCEGCCEWDSHYEPKDEQTDCGWGEVSREE